MRGRLGWEAAGLCTYIHTYIHTCMHTCIQGNHKRTPSRIMKKKRASKNKEISVRTTNFVLLLVFVVSINRAYTFQQHVTSPFLPHPAPPTATPPPPSSPPPPPLPHLPPPSTGRAPKTTTRLLPLLLPLLLLLLLKGDGTGRPEPCS